MHCAQSVRNIYARRISPIFQADILFAFGWMKKEVMSYKLDAGTEEAQSEAAVVVAVAAADAENKLRIITLCNDGVHRNAQNVTYR